MNTRLDLALALAALALAGCNCGSDTCRTGGIGNIVITWAGLPSGAAGEVTLTGPSLQTVSGPQLLSNVGSGTWTVESGRATQPDPRVRAAFTSAASTFCLAPGTTRSVEVQWSQVPTSNKLWWLNGGADNGALLGFASAGLGASNTVGATVNADTATGKDLTFDRDGNVWALGATVGDPLLVRYAASGLGSSGRKAMDRGLNVKGLNCASGLAFSPAGDLFVSANCNKVVVKLPASSLTVASGLVTPVLTLTGFSSPQGLAFDKAGNLWVADTDAQAIYRYDSAALARTNATPSAHVSVKASDDPESGGLLSPGWLAFDAAGNLWSNDFGGNVIFEVPAADLASTGTLSPRVRITVGVEALLEGLAFDESGGVWTALSVGRFARLGPAQLTMSSGAGAPTTPETIINSGEVGYASNVALYPAPAALPLFHRLP